jgi:hypothetical protein
MGLLYGCAGRLTAQNGGRVLRSAAVCAAHRGVGLRRPGAELAAAGELRRGGRRGLLGAHAVALAAALSGLTHRPKTGEHAHPILGLANDVQAVVALARLGIGTDARWPPKVKFTGLTQNLQADPEV